MLNTLARRAAGVQGRERGCPPGSRHGRTVCAAGNCSYANSCAVRRVCETFPAYTDLPSHPPTLLLPSTRTWVELIKAGGLVVITAGQEAQVVVAGVEDQLVEHWEGHGIVRADPTVGQEPRLRAAIVQLVAGKEQVPVGR